MKEKERWLVEMSSTSDGMVWFDGKRINPNDARELGRALDLLSLLAFSQKPRSMDIPIIIDRRVKK